MSTTGAFWQTVLALELIPGTGTEFTFTKILSVPVQAPETMVTTYVVGLVGLTVTL